MDVAIKELRLPPWTPETERAERLARATREARNAARLRKHDGIVAIHDIVMDDGLPWIVMELVHGCSLSEFVEANGPLPVGRAVEVAAALLTAIGAAHREGVVHRDIKPANIMLAENGKVLLTDFGTAIHHTDSALTVTGMFIGSAEYMAPERLRGGDAPTGDLFSLGVTLYQAVEGVSPFRRDTQEATLAAVLLEEAPEPQRTGPLTQLITRLLDKDQGRRPTVDEALATLGDRAGEQSATTAHVRRDTNVVLAGLVCASLARFLPANVGKIVTAVVGVAGLVFGCGATAFAFHGAGEIFGSAMELSVRESATVSLTLISIIVVVAVGSALSSQLLVRRERLGNSPSEALRPPGQGRPSTR